MTDKAAQTAVEQARADDAGIRRHVDVPPLAFRPGTTRLRAAWHRKHHPSYRKPDVSSSSS